MCTDNENDMDYKNGDYWRKKSDPCTHCSCYNGTIRCYRENCTINACEEVTKYF